MNYKNCVYCFSVLVTLLFLVSVVAADPNHPITIRKFDELENIDIIYDYPDFSHPRIRFTANEQNEPVVREVEASHIARFCDVNSEIAPDEDDLTTIAHDNYTKKIFESISHGYYIVSLAMLYQDGQYIYGNFKNDLLLWKETPEGYELVELFPESIGGCLFCGSHFTEYSGDTLVINFDGKGPGEIWGGKEVFTIKDNTIRFIRSERFRRFIPFRGKANPITGAISQTVAQYFYDAQGNLKSSSIFFDARFSDNKPVFLYSKSDSLQLFEASADFLHKPLKYVKTVSSAKKQIRVGPVQGNLISIFWEGRWYLSRRNDFLFEPVSSTG
jgi:hypothetical protein